MEADLRRLRSAVRNYETEIAGTEEELDRLRKQLEIPEIAADYEKAIEISSGIEKLNTVLDGLLADWGEATAALEEE